MSALALPAGWKSVAPVAAGVLVVALSVACVLAGNGDLIVAATPALVLGGLYAAWTLPLRGPLLATTFLAITLENPADAPAAGQWKSPLYEVGEALLVHLNLTLPVKALIFSGLDVMLLCLFLVAAVRYFTSARGWRHPAAGRTSGPSACSPA